MIWLPRKTNETNRFKVKTWEGFDLTIFTINKSIMIECKFTNDLTPKSNATSSRTY